MEMEAHSFAPERARQLTMKVKEYKADLAKLRQDARAAASQVALPCLCSSRCVDRAARGLLRCSLWGWQGAWSLSCGQLLVQLAPHLPAQPSGQPVAASCRQQRWAALATPGQQPELHMWAPQALAGAPYSLVGQAATAELGPGGTFSSQTLPACLQHRAGRRAAAGHSLLPVGQESGGAAARAELGLGGNFSTSSAGQRERMLGATGKLQQTGDRITQGRQQLLETEVGTHACACVPQNLRTRGRFADM